MQTISRTISALQAVINWPAETYFLRPHSKEHVYHGERKPPSLSGSVEKKNGGLRDVLGITTLILGSLSSFERAPFFAFGVGFRLGVFSELVASLPLAALLLLVSIFPLEMAFRLTLGILRIFLRALRRDR